MWPSPGSSKIYSDPPLPPDKHGLWLDCATIPWSFTQTHLLARITQPPIAYFSAITVYPGPFRQLTFLFTFALLWIIFVWFSQSKLGEYADLFISNGFDSLELIFECVDKQLLEEQFAEGICLPGKRQQLLLAIRQQKESKPPRQTEMSMYDWFQENDISSYFNAFINKGYDDLEVQGRIQDFF